MKPKKIGRTIQLKGKWLEQLPPEVRGEVSLSRKTTKAQVRRVLTAPCGIKVEFAVWYVHSGARVANLHAVRLEIGGLRLGCATFTPFQTKVIRKWARAKA